jgi:hypothetical protein
MKESPHVLGRAEILDAADSEFQLLRIGIWVPRIE